MGATLYTFDAFRNTKGGEGVVHLGAINQGRAYCRARLRFPEAPWGTPFRHLTCFRRLSFFSDPDNARHLVPRDRYCRRCARDAMLAVAGDLLLGTDDA